MSKSSNVSSKGPSSDNETLEFFEISVGSSQPLNVLPYLTLSTQYPIFISWTKLIKNWLYGFGFLL